MLIELRLSFRVHGGLIPVAQGNATCDQGKVCRRLSQHIMAQHSLHVVKTQTGSNRGSARKTHIDLETDSAFVVNAHLNVARPHRSQSLRNPYRFLAHPCEQSSSPPLSTTPPNT